MVAHDGVGTSASPGKSSKPEADKSMGMWMGWPTLGDALFLEASKLLARLRKAGGGPEHKGTADALVEELEELNGWQRAAHAADVLQHFIDAIAGRDDFIISRALKRAVRGELIMAMAIYMAQVVCSIAMPITAYIMLRWCENPEAPAWEGYAIMGGMAVANVLAVLLKELFVKRCSIMGEWTMSACQTLAYRKLLRLAVSDAFASNVGCISELVSGSSDALLGYWPALIGLLLQPIEILMLVGALYVFVGWAAFGGVAVVVVALACSVSMGRMLETHSAKRGDAAERHSQLVSEAVTAIKAIKYNVWESRFEARIRRSKEEEMRIVRRCGRILSVLNVSSNPSIDLISCGVVSLYVLAHGSTLTPAVLAAYWVLLALLHGKIFEFPENVRAHAEATQALKSFASFLSRAEVHARLPAAIAPIPARENGRDVELSPLDAKVQRGKVVMGLKNVSFAWGVGGGGAEGNAIAEASVSKRVGGGDVKGGGAEGPNAAVSSVRSGLGSVPILSGADLTVCEGDLIGVCGSVGSGKSTLLLLLLSELRPDEGDATFHDDWRSEPVALVSQTPWIISGTVRRNVTLGARFDFDQAWYDSVCEACALTYDLSLLPSGDMTLIGERGVNLSGGQKQRISLARAAYSRARSILLDDPLSALDPSVRSHVWRHCINGVMSPAARVVVSPDAALLQDCGKVVELTGGGLRPVDASDHRRRVDGVVASSHAGGGLGKGVDVGDVVLAGNAGLGAGAGLGSGNDSLAVAKPLTATAGFVHDDVGPRMKEVVVAGAHEEARAGGGEGYEGSRRPWFRVARSTLDGVGGHLIGLLIITLFAMEITVIEMGVWFLRDLADAGLRQGSVERSTSSYYLGLYGIMVSAELLLCFTRNNIYSPGISKSVLALHRRLLSSLLDAPLSYFDDRRTGDVVQLFSQQLPQLDTKLHMALDFYMYGAGFLLFISVMCAVYIWWIPGVFILLLLILLSVMSEYDGTEPLRKTKESLRTPIHSHFASTLDGIISIRAYKVEEEAERDMCRLSDSHARVSLACNEIQGWLNNRIMLLSAALYCATALGLVLHSVHHGPLASLLSPLSPADSSFILLNLCFASFCLHTAVTRHMDLVALARVRNGLHETVASTPREAPRVVASPTTPPRGAAAPSSKNWPEDGRVLLEGVIARYPMCTEPAVRGLSVSLSCGEKLAVVGRTGAGKSTVVAVLTRMLELQGGRVSISGVDISKIGLDMLRESLSVVCQEPVIFAGTVRRNLDPFNERGDDDLWQALERSSLSSFVVSQGGLDALVADLGENLSVGQRQLLCVARAVLRRRRILILDEATSSLDSATEQVVLRAVKLGAGQATTIQVAHRLPAIVGSDRVLVMERGIAAEVGEPSELLRDPEGKLSKMVESLGAAAARSLRDRFFEAAAVRKKAG